MNGKDEFINKKNLLQEFANEIYKFDSVDEEFQRGVDWALRMTIKHPTADVEEIRHGKWVTITVPRHDPHGEKLWLCTNCERAWRKELLVDIAFGVFPKRCPECGAYMRKGKEE